MHCRNQLSILTRCVGVRATWAETLHKNVVGKDWPPYLQETVAEMVERNEVTLGSALVSRKQRKIEIPHLAPVYLFELMNILAYPIVKPNSRDPSAKMLIHGGKIPEAAKRLARLVSMLEHTSYIENSAFEWNPLLIFFSRFIYYHELAHTTSLFVGTFAEKFRLDRHEYEFEEEMRADYLALSFLLAELRNNPQLLHIAFSGISLGMSFLAVHEFSMPYTKDLRAIKGAHFRMARIKYWVSEFAKHGNVPQKEVAALNLFWRMCSDLLRHVKVIPSPAYSILSDAAKGSEEDWVFARNELVRWITFGNREAVVANLKSVYNWAVGESNTEEGGRKVMDVLHYVLEQTRDIETELGLQAAVR